MRDCAGGAGNRWKPDTESKGRTKVEIILPGGCRLSFESSSCMLEMDSHMVIEPSRLDIKF